MAKQKVTTGFRFNGMPYKKGRAYDLPEDAAKFAATHGYLKADKAAPENKADKAAPENKAE